MKLILQSTNILADLMNGAIFVLVGGYILLRRKKIVNALLASSELFWKEFGVNQNKYSRFMSNIMIPLCGAVFFGVGVLFCLRCLLWLIYKIGTW